ncbi:protein CROWDED NUCLEI 1-like [Nicotiana tomentosiformis]|uniref:protein CROWDED NUCLEI 1-like n=1 Tax=Nicotiana tomentosiformis TaxID=4098 RepID=UPI00388CB0BF
MSKISKTVHQKEAASSSRPAGEKPVVEPCLEELVPGECVIDSDFKVEKPSSVAGRYEPVSRYICSIPQSLLVLVKKDCAWENKEVLIPAPEEVITTHVEGYLSVYTYPFTMGLTKDAVMRPSSGDEEALPPISKLENVASVLHHEALLQSRGELSRYEAEVRRLTEERDAFKLLSEQRKGEVKRLRAELEASQKEQTELAEQVKKIFEFNDIDSGVMANNSIPQVEQKLNVIRQLRVEMDVVKSEAKERKKNMDRIASEEETARTQLASAEGQLRSLKEKTLVQAKKIEEFQSRLSLADSNRERLSTELAATKLEVEKAMANVDAMVVVYRSDVKAAQVRAKEVAEAAQARANWVAEHAKCQSRRETLEEIHTRGFDLTIKIEKAKELKAKTEYWLFPMMMIPGVRADMTVKGASRAKMLLLQRTKSFSIFCVSYKTVLVFCKEI